MMLEQANKIIENNYSMSGDALTAVMHDKCTFSMTAFWDYFEAISCVTRAAVKNDLLTMWITIGYQQFLKEMIYHFDPKDIAEMEQFPENHNDYIERLDYAIRAYLENKPELLDDNLFELHR